MNRQVFFATFRDALTFLERARIGKVHRRPDAEGFVWDSDSSRVTEDVEGLIAEADGSKYVWTDAETGLTWLLRERIRYAEIESLNADCFGGYNDWRVPTLRELKTLASTEKNKAGNYVKDGLEGKIDGNYESRTRYDAHDTAWWNFRKNDVEVEQYTDGKIKWGAEGGFAGFEKSKSQNSARLILVRGSENHRLTSWAKKLTAWAEAENVWNFPATQRGIEELGSLSFSAETLPPEIQMLPNLKRLTCYLVPGIADTLFSLSKVEDLRFYPPYAKSTYLDTLPAGIKSLQGLVSLVATQLGLREVHQAIGEIETLQSLDLSYNKLETIPASLGNLSHLRALDLAANPVRTLPASLSQLGKLERLRIRVKLDQTLPWLAYLARIKELSINAQRMTEFPKDASFYFLEQLRCAAPLERLPPYLDKLANLHTLELSGTCLQDFPEVLTRMSSVKVLRINSSPIRRIPDEIAGMTYLERLDLAGTQISELPKSMLALEKLHYLNISSTPLKILPDWLCELRSLSRIDGMGVGGAKVPDVLRDKLAHRKTPAP